MRTRFISILVSVMLVLSLASTAMAADSGATANNPDPADRLNLRTKPSEDAPTLGKYYNGTFVEVLGAENNGWVKVRFEGLEGYMMAKHLAFGEARGQVGSAIPAVIIHNVGGTGLHLRKSQSTSSSSLGLYPNGQQVLVYGVGKTWCHVQTEDGKIGFMLREKLSPLLEFDGTGGEGSAFGKPGDPITENFMPGGNG